MVGGRRIIVMRHGKQEKNINVLECQRDVSFLVEDEGSLKVNDKNCVELVVCFLTDMFCCQEHQTGLGPFAVTNLCPSST